MVRRRNPFRSTDSSSFYLIGKYIGVYVPQYTADLLHIHAVSKNTNLQGLLCEIIANWQEEQDTIEDLLSNLADKAHMEWMSRKPQMTNSAQTKKELSKYKIEIRDYLQKKKIQESYIRKIISEFEEKL